MFPGIQFRKMKPSALLSLFEEAVEQQVARKPAGKNPLDDREGPDILGNWFLHHEKNEKQEPQDPHATQHRRASSPRSSLRLAAV